MRCKKAARLFAFAAGAGLILAGTAAAVENVREDARTVSTADVQDQPLHTALQAWFRGDDASADAVAEAMTAGNSSNPIPWQLKAWMLFERYTSPENLQKALSFQAAALRLSQAAPEAYSALLPLCRSAVQAGLPRAQFFLGRMYELALGVLQDYGEALRLYKLAADQGYALALTNLAALCKQGQGCARDETAAMKYYLKALELAPDNPVFIYNVALMYFEGRGAPKNPRKALEMFKEAAWAGLPDAYGSLGYLYLMGEGVKADAAEALRWLKKGVELGSSLAQNTLGAMYSNGDGVEKDEKEAVRLYKLAAESGLFLAQNNLADAYFRGLGVEEDQAEALRWYRLAAEQGDGNAQNSLGLQYLYGRGTAQDFAEALKWFRLAAESGSVDALQNIAHIYFNGWGVKKDASQAARWVRRAAQQGLAEAQYNLGCLYNEGVGIRKDEKQAFYWFSKAAEQGYAAAQNNLGQAYRNGSGVPVDEGQAYKWYAVAAEHGDPLGLFNLGLCFKEGFGTPQDLREAYVCFALADMRAVKEAAQQMKEIEVAGFAADKAESDRILAEARARVKKLSEE